MDRKCRWYTNYLSHVNLRKITLLVFIFVGTYFRGFAIEMLQKSPKLPKNDRIFQNNIFCGYKFSRTLSKRTARKYVSYSILPESRDLLGFYCRASTIYNIMLLTLILILNFSCPLSKENAVGFIHPLYYGIHSQRRKIDCNEVVSG